MIRLSETQIEGKSNFINQYMKSANAADGSRLDANANVSAKNISTLESELHKDINIQLNRHLVQNKIRSLFGEELAQNYVRQIEAHEIYVHDETSLKPYCVSISMYPFLLDGITTLGGESKAPKNISSFCGSFVNLIFAISAQFAGAVATVEFLTYFDHFARREWGEGYLAGNEKAVHAYFQQVVYSLNQPAAARGYQSVFWNISLYDQHYFESLFEGFVFPDGDIPKWSSVESLQEFFMKWFNQEREKALLTFPVVTVAMLTENNQVKDRNFAQFYANELAQGNSFFIYLSDTPDSLASCCRLRNEISNQGFSYSLGAGGVATGSLNVITINMNRLVQNGRSLEEQVKNIHKYQVAYRQLMEDFKVAGLLPVYDAGYISFDKQYLTIGINGMVEAAEYLNITISDNDDYKAFLKNHLQIIYELNKKARADYGYMFNTEFVPAENLGVKNAKWDARDGLKTYRECYNSYFYVVEDEGIDFVDKFQLHGREVIQYLDGGSALHLNLEEYLTPAQYMLLLDNAARVGCNYFCTNVKVTICNDCAMVTKRTQSTCSACGSDHVDYATRVIGYLKRVSSFSSARQKEHDRRFYHLESQHKDFATKSRSRSRETAVSGHQGF